MVKWIHWILGIEFRSFLYTDDEVRDRATYYKMVLQEKSKEYVFNTLNVSIPSLEYALKNYTLSNCLDPFDIKAVPTELPKSTGDSQSHTRACLSTVIGGVAKMNLI